MQLEWVVQITIYPWDNFISKTIIRISKSNLYFELIELATSLNGFCCELSRDNWRAPSNSTLVSLKL